MSQKTTYQVIGTRPIRHDGVDKVTGRALYGADFSAAGLLHGKILRSPHAHAVIRKIDTSKALAVPGVEAVMTAADLPDLGNRTVELGEGAIVAGHLSQIIMARQKVLFKGQPVAAVAAVSPHVAEEALALIQVDYEVLPCVTDVLAAMKPGAPILHADIKAESTEQGKVGQPTNIAKHIPFAMGDIAKGFAEAAVVAEEEFRMATVHQGYIEAQTATAMWNADGTITIWSSTQGAFTVRNQTAAMLDIPISRLKVIPMEVGGGFGGKIRIYVEPVAAVLSHKTGKPVKVIMSRSDVFQGTGPTAGGFIRVKMGADKNGRLTAAQAYMAYDAGAFPGSLVGAGAMCIFACYDIPHIKIDAYDVVVNKPATSAYRAPGATIAAFAAESVVGELCAKLKIDPCDFRIKNGAHEGTRRADGPVYGRIGMIESVEAAKKSAHYTSPLAPNTPLAKGGMGGAGLPRGRGVASGFWFNIGLKSSATASVNADGTVSLVEGSTDLCGTRVTIAMQLAEALGLRAEDVKPVVADTDMVGYTDVTGGSRVTFATGWAAYEAAQDIKRQMMARAAEIWGVKPDQVVYENGSLCCTADKAKHFTFKELAAKLHATGGTIVGRASVDPPGAGGAFGTHVVDVEVDPDTGKINILRFTATQDVGKAIHPGYVEGQIQGGATQGIGWGLHEEYAFNDKGEMTNPTFLDYRMPTTLDVPMIETVLVEVPNPGHPYGVRGVGEVPIIPPPGAIANAVFNAVGVRLHELPMSPGRVLKALQAKK